MTKHFFSFQMSSCHHSGIFEGREVCIRKFQLHELGSEQSVDELAETLTLYSAVDHPLITQFFGVFRIGLNLYVVSEFMKGGSLTDVIQSASVALPQKTMIKLAKQVCRAMHFLHSRKKPNPNGILHGHLTSSNILLDATGTNVKIGDVGSSRVTTCSELAFLGQREMGFAAPEVLGGEVLTAASEVYAFGMVLWHMIYLQVPHAGKSVEDIRKVTQNQALPLTLDPRPGIEPRVLEIIKSCWLKNPTERPTFEALYKKFEESFAL
jgi:serine/threonine protein kinase